MQSMQTLEMTQKPGPLLFGEWSSPAYIPEPVKVELGAKVIRRSGTKESVADEKAAAPGGFPQSPAPARPPALPLSLQGAEPPVPPPPPAVAPLPVISLSLADALSTPGPQANHLGYAPSPSADRFAPPMQPPRLEGHPSLSGASFGSMLPRSPPPASPPCWSAAPAPLAGLPPMPGSLPISLSAALPPPLTPSVQAFPVADAPRRDLYQELCLAGLSASVAAGGAAPQELASARAKVELAKLLEAGSPSPADRGVGQGLPSPAAQSFGGAGMQLPPGLLPPPGLESPPGLEPVAEPKDSFLARAGLLGAADLKLPGAERHAVWPMCGLAQWDAADDCTPTTCVSSDKESTVALSDTGSEHELTTGSEQDTPRSGFFPHASNASLIDLPPGLDLPAGIASHGSLLHKSGAKSERKSRQAKSRFGMA